MKNSIPLFPLKIVVFPYSKIPLHIFEERYKKMIGKCLKEKSGFGIVSLVKRDLSEIGSYVEVVEVSNKFQNGEMDIIIKGILRFKLTKTQKHNDGYLIGNVEEYQDISIDFDKNLLEELKNNFLSILKKINFKMEENFWQSYDNSELKSFKIAEKAGLSFIQQQKLLTLRKENARINFLLRHLKKLGKQVDENILTGAIILGDGYLN